jgi:hypothetical protein
MTDLYALISATITISLIGVSAIVLIMILRPSTDNFQVITTILGFLAPTLFTYMSLLKSYQNGTALKEVKISVDGNIQKLLDQAGTVATLTEQVQSAKEAAKVAAATSVTTAALVAAAQPPPPVIQDALKKVIE